MLVQNLFVFFFRLLTTYKFSHGLVLGKVMVCLGLVGQTDSPPFGYVDCGGENIARFPLKNHDVLDAQWEYCKYSAVNVSTCGFKFFPSIPR